MQQTKSRPIINACWWCGRPIDNKFGAHIKCMNEATEEEETN